MTELLPEDPATYEVGYLGPEAQAALRDRFRADGIEFVWEGSVVHVAGIDEGLAFARIAEAGAGSYAAAHAAAAADLVSARPEPEEPLASGWRRIAGWVVDGYLVMFVGNLLVVPVIGWHVAGLQPVAYRIERFVLLGLANFVCIARPMARSGRTIGMKVADIRVVTLAGGSLGYRRAIVRCAVPMSAGLVSIAVVPGALRAILPAAVPLATYLPIRLRSDHRGLHDVLAGTVVVREWFRGVPPLDG